MRRVKVVVGLAAIVALLAAGSAQAAVPSLGAVSVTNIQGVSAVLKGSVDPEGLSTTYFFEYSTQANFSGAPSTSVAAAGQGTALRPARAAIAGLAPDTVYHYRLVATNASGKVTGSAATFTTTHGFGFMAGTSGFAADAVADGGAAATRADEHPYELDFHVGLNRAGEFEDQPGAIFSDGDLRDLTLELPAGLMFDPGALPTCTQSQFHTPRSSPFETAESGESCPDATQVGTVEINTSAGGGQARRFGLFSLEAPPGVPAQLGFAPFGSPVALDVDLRPGADGSYTLALRAVNVPQSLNLYGLQLSLWGTPWAASHNGERGNCLNEAEPMFPWAKCSVGEPRQKPPLAYVTLPPACSGPLSFAAVADSWQQPAQVSATAVSRDQAGSEGEMGSCGSLAFAPEASTKLSDTKASAPTGYEFRMATTEGLFTNPGLQSPPPAKKLVLALPEGATVNPSVGAGLGVCTPAQYAAESAVSPQGAGCPNNSKVGDFTVRTPLFGQPLEGAVYLAQPDDPATTTPGAENPFDSLLALYLVAKLPSRGVLVKVAGKVDADPATGRLTVTFDGMPQIPSSELSFNLRTGQRSLLATPAACGAASGGIELTPWASTVSAVHSSTSSPITAGYNGGACPAGTPPFNPSVVAGGVNANVNSYTPYFIHLGRQDNEQEFTSYSLVLPKGITGKLAGIPFCSDAAIEAAKGRSGLAQVANPSCPAASQVGQVLSGYGVGPSLTYAKGAIYLAGPYHGAPLSLVTINPATVGPFDLGTIVVRSAFQIDPLTAQLRIDSSASDPIPHILDGIPLHLRDIRISLDRPEFTHNPSSCEPSALVSTVGGSGARFGDSSDDTTVTASAHFQLLNCLTLGFKPKLGLRLRGGVHRGSYPSLRATFAARGAGDSNLKEISVTIPQQLFLAQNHIRKICTLPQFAAGQCPAESVYGSAVAYTPLLDQPLRGNVYLRSAPTRRLPDLVADLHSGSVRIVLEGRIGPGKHGGIQADFAELPDEPLERFVMTLNGGKRGLLVNSANICSVPPTASVKALAQNNLGDIFTTKLRGQCGKKEHGKGKHGKHGKHQHGGGKR